MSRRESGPSHRAQYVKAPGACGSEDQSSAITSRIHSESALPRIENQSYHIPDFRSLNLKRPNTPSIDGLGASAHHNSDDRALWWARHRLVQDNIVNRIRSGKAIAEGAI